MNMDGNEWRRKKSGIAYKIWVYFNELIGEYSAHVPISDCPEIAKHIRSLCLRSPAMILYGSEEVTSASADCRARFDLKPDQCSISIARVEPESSIPESARGVSRIPNGFKLIVFGAFDLDNNDQRVVKDSAGFNAVPSCETYEPETVKMLRFHGRAHLHGHRVGGTDPSLVEALGADNAIPAHHNGFNRWITGSEQFFSQDTSSLAAAIKRTCSDRPTVTEAKRAARLIHRDRFQRDPILEAYKKQLKLQSDRIG